MMGNKLKSVFYTNFNKQIISSSFSLSHPFPIKNLKSAGMAEKFPRLDLWRSDRTTVGQCSIEALLKDREERNPISRGANPRQRIKRWKLQILLIIGKVLPFTLIGLHNVE